MYNYLHDIIDKLGEPLWWDGGDAIPRYCEFLPNELNDIYARECALILTQCQNCGHIFNIAISWDDMSNGKSLSEKLKNGFVIGFADPPNIKCCGAGSSMTSDKIKVLEFWKQNKKFEWERIPELEIEFDY
jgi:hypothetical protein